MPSRLALLSIVLLSPAIARAQFTDDFEDGDLSARPVWTGDLEHWAIENGAASKRLVTRGLPQTDTLVLQTPASGPFGTWGIRYGYTGGPLSNFNQVRIVVWAAADGDAQYYLLVGTNDRTLKLYRAADDSASRELIGSAAADLLDTDMTDLAIRIEHSYNGIWRVYLNGTPVIEEPEENTRFFEDGLFRLWVKHTTSRGSDHWFDDVSASPRVESDTVRPSLSAIVTSGSQSLAVRFTEPVTTASACRSETYEITSTLTGEIEVQCPARPYTDTLRIRRSTPFPPGTHTLTAHDVADPSGNVRRVDTMAFAVGESGEVPEPGDLVINEIDFAPSPPESEFVEILNVSSKRIDLSAVSISDDRSRAPITFETTLADPGSYVVLTRDYERLASRFPEIDAVQVAAWPTLNNGGDSVSILYGADTVDVVVYAPPSGSAGSLERVDPRSPSDLPQNWLSSLAADGATPGGVNSVYAPDVTGPDLVFVEQTSDIALRAVFSEAIPVARLHRNMFELDGDTPTLLAPGAPRYSTDFYLAFAAVDAGTLRVSLVADAAGNTTAAGESVVHVLPRRGDLVINEVMFEPRIDELDGLADQAEYVEIRNLSPNPVSINACTLSGPENEHGESTTKPIRALPQGVPGAGYALILDSRINAHSMPFFAEVRPDLLRPLGTGSLSLRNQGSRITISCDGQEIDVAGYNPDWHHPALASSRGISLERISAVAPSDDPRTWTSSTDPSGGTPGRLNSVATPEWVPEEALEISPSPFAPDATDGRQSTTILYRLKSDRAYVRVTVFNSRGRAVRHLTRGRISPRVSSVVWDGRDDAGVLVTTGIYVVFVEATDAELGTVERHRAPVVVVRGFN